MTETTPTAELMRTLDEKFIADPMVFATMRPTGGIITSGEGFLDADGALDREAIRALVARAVALFPAARLRLRPMPLGLSTPAWVAAEPDLDYHVRFRDHCAPDEVAALLGGAFNGELDLERPLWTILGAPLPDGEVAIVLQLHHALGDGLFGLRLVEALTGNEPFDVHDLPEHPREVSPDTPFGIWRIAFRDWRTAHPGWAAGWREYTRKSFLRRLRRTGGRLLRPRRFAAPVTPPERRYALDLIDYAEVKLAARDAECSVHDLFVTAALEAVAAEIPDADPTALLVPISRRAGAGGEERNHISMIRVELPGTPEGATAGVAEQIAEGVAGRAAPVPSRRDWPGYTSFLPWKPRHRYSGEASVRAVTLWPVLEPSERLGVFGSMYNGLFSIAVTTAVDLDPVALAERTRERMFAQRRASSRVA